jgi:hypothetical protein
MAEGSLSSGDWARLVYELKAGHKGHTILGRGLETDCQGWLEVGDESDSGVHVTERTRG